MQDMIEFLKNAMDMCHDSDEKINFAWVKFHAELLLEKEKEQIIKAVEDTRGNIVPRYYLKENINGEEYYNQTYNQNK